MKKANKEKKKKIHVLKRGKLKVFYKKAQNFL